MTLACQAEKQKIPSSASTILLILQISALILQKYAYITISFVES